jgi:hypothetical protein
MRWPSRLVTGPSLRGRPARLRTGGLDLNIATHRRTAHDSVAEVTLSRDAAGRWRFRLHKKPMSDSTLGRLLGKLLSTYTNGPVD